MFRQMNRKKQQLTDKVCIDILKTDDSAEADDDLLTIIIAKTTGKSIFTAGKKAIKWMQSGEMTRPLSAFLTAEFGLRENGR